MCKVIAFSEFPHIASGFVIIHTLVIWLSTYHELERHLVPGSLDMSCSAKAAYTCNYITHYV